MTQAPVAPPPLSFLEARILGVLIEKEKTTPDTYPLTLNSLAAGCNQRSARDPAISAAEGEIQEALESLRSRLLVLETYGASGRVLRYAHNLGRVYAVPAASVALLATLALRGAQTISELRANSERLYRFDDSSSVEAYLQELATRNAGALVVCLPKQPGSREHRWAHLLCGEPTLPANPANGEIEAGGASGDLTRRVACLEQEVAELRGALQALRPKVESPDPPATST
ncbi:MAG TPA: YceH family protein [Accumulibacter sp.]|uniref:YceH family protein n=1 Tax=Accumulibacter sp. TaxID=2053492 RepID=UPI002D097B91|nr:YceH family protein [Accumulibacter sp.]HRD90472.1 YceH family protein [Accumulibacter sp.]